MACSLALVLFLQISTLSVQAKPAVRTLSEEPRIEYISKFVSSEDAAALRELSATIGMEALGEASATHEANGGNDVLILNRTAVLQDAIDPEDADLSADGWGAASRFEAAAAAWAKLPIGQASTVITRWDSWIPGFNRSGPLHLDARRRPFHQKTVLAFLSGTDKSGGSKNSPEEGFTVFPCVETDDMDAKEAKRRHRICSRAARHVRLTHERLLKTHAEGMELHPSKQYAFLQEHPELTQLPKELKGGVRPIDWQWTAANDAVGEAADSIRADPLFALADAMCHGKAQGLKVRPEKGAAIMFEASSRGRDGTMVPDWQMWHAGCSPSASHGHRWTAQIFLDGPDSRRATEIDTTTEESSVSQEECKDDSDRTQ